MTTISKEKTFSFQEKELLNAGFTCEILDRFISRYKNGTKYAFIIYSAEDGFETKIFDTSKEVK